MSPGNNSGAPPKIRRNRRLLIALAIVVVLITIFLLGIGRWLVTDDKLEKAQAIVVLSGRMPMRAMEAAKLYRAGYAPQVWLTHSTEPGAELATMGISFEGEDTYDQRVLIHGGVPSGAIRVIQPPIMNTADELAAVSTTMANEKDNIVIIVTSKVHTRRVRTLWRRFAGTGERAIVHAPSDDPFQPGRWWRTTGDALDVVREILGILNAWAGMPLRPAN